MDERDRPIGIGIVGFGTAGRSFLPAIRRHPGFELVAVADCVPAVREEIARESGVTAHAELGTLLEHPAVQVVYIATPTCLHAEQVLQSLAAGKHVLVEKPMAEDVARALPLVDAARRSGRVVLVGHSHGYDLPVQRMRELIASGEFGRVRMAHTWCYTDWMHRPRRPDELDASQGGGVIYRQGAHQFDVLRLLCGGRVRSVRARTFDWNPRRPGTGAHVAYLDFEDGAVATAVYNGYGGFSSVDLCFGITESGFHQPARYSPRPSAAAGSQSMDDVLRAKQARARSVDWSTPPHQPFFGLTVVSCERADIRQSPDGLLVYDEHGCRSVALPFGRGPRDLVLDELHDAVTGRCPALHDARWGLANLEVCDAARDSCASGRDVLLRHQVGVDESRAESTGCAGREHLRR